MYMKPRKQTQKARRTPDARPRTANPGTPVRHERQNAILQNAVNAKRPRKADRKEQTRKRQNARTPITRTYLQRRRRSTPGGGTLTAVWFLRKRSLSGGGTKDEASEGVGEKTRRTWTSDSRARRRGAQAGLRGSARGGGTRTVSRVRVREGDGEGEA
ncbi:hypothetical protein BKA81DRAFT_84708 [Phyllosticta paracitricarpa]